MLKKSSSRPSFVALAAASTLGLAIASDLRAVELLSNGDFETGTFAGWTVTDLAGGTGSWFIDTPGSTSPVSTSATAGNAAGGSFYAVTDQGGPGTHSLTQSFAVAPGAASVIFSFQMFANDQSGFAPSVNAAGLDHTAVPNQHVRVDVLTGAALPFDTGAGVLANFFLGDDAGVNPNPFTSYAFDITALVAAGGTFQIRFAEVDNQLFYQMGVDNVSVTVDGLAVPEPGSLALLGVAVAGIGLLRRRAPSK
jgi:hypothetical protein